MKLRHLQGIGLLAAMTLILTAGSSALASRAPQVPVGWQFGVSSTFGGTRFDGAYDAATKRVYFLGFRTFADATDGSVWYYDTVAKTYTDTGVDMPVPVSNYQIATLTDSRGLGFYIFGGRAGDATITTTVQAYYPAVNRALTINSDPWPGTTPAACISLPAMGVATVGNRAYVMGGLSFAANGCVDDQSAQTWVFDPNGAAGAKWTAGPNLNVARGYITPAVLGGRIYAIGGDTNVAGTLIPSASVEAWKPPAGGWNDVAVADLPQACDESQAFAFPAGPLANTITLAGCGQWPNALPDTLQYSVAGNAWANVGVLREPVRNHAGVLIPTGTTQVMFILGGYDCPGNVCLADPTQLSEQGRATHGSGPAAPSHAGTANGSASTN